MTDLPPTVDRGMVEVGREEEIGVREREEMEWCCVTEAAAVAAAAGCSMVYEGKSHVNKYW